MQKNVKGENISFDDDIYTTGSTLDRGGESAEKGRSRKCILFDGKYWTRNLIFVILKVMHIRIKRMR